MPTMENIYGLLLFSWLAANEAVPKVPQQEPPAQAPAVNTAAPPPVNDDDSLADLLGAWQHKPVINHILADIQAAYNTAQHPVVLIEVDDAVFDKRTRTWRILQAFSQQERQATSPQLSPQQIATLQNITWQQVLSDANQTLQSLKITDAAVMDAAQAFWLQHFFKEEALQYDTVHKATVVAIRDMYQRGAKIAYVSTTRNTQQQLLGTVRGLRDAGLPIGILATELLLKPTADTPVDQHLKEVCDYIRHNNPVVAVFTSDLEHAKLFGQAFINTQNNTSIILVHSKLPQTQLALLPNNIHVLESF